MLDMGFIHDIRRIDAPRCRRSGRRCSSPRPCPRTIAALAGRAPQATRSRSRCAPVADHGRAGRAARLLRRAGGASARCWPSCSSDAGDHAGDRLHPHQARRRPGRASTSRRAGIRPRRSTATSRRTRASARSATSRPAARRVLVATDIAARGIDVDDITHVVNFDLPERARDLRPPHRPHRPRRRRGPAISFCDTSERGSWRAIESLIRQRVPVLEVEGSRATGAERAAHQRAEAYEPAPRNGRGGAAPSGRDGSGPRRYQGAGAPAGGRPAASRSAPGRSPYASTEGRRTAR